MHKRHRVPQEALGLHLVEHAEIGGDQPVHDPVEMLGAVHEVQEDGIHAAPEGDGVPEVGPTGEELVGPVVDQRTGLGLGLQAGPLVRARNPALEPDLHDAVEDVVGLGLDARRRLRVEPDLRRPDPVRVLLVDQLVEEVVGDDRIGGVDRLGHLVHLDPESVQSQDLRDEQHRLDDHVRPHVVPAIQRPAQVDLDAPVERVDALVDEKWVTGQLVPGELVEGNHRALRPQIVDALPERDGLLLNGQGGDLRDATSELPQDLAVRGGLDHCSRPLGTTRSDSSSAGSVSKDAPTTRQQGKRIIVRRLVYRFSALRSSPVEGFGPAGNGHSRTTSGAPRRAGRAAQR